MSAATQMERAYEFRANLERWSVSLDDRLSEAYRNIIFVLLMNIVVGGLYSPGTPVDTGFARNSWVVGIGGVGVFRQPDQPADRHATVTLTADAEGQAILADVRIGDEVHITSNCAYMMALEEGHSGQAPTGMVWLALSASQQIVDATVAEMLS